MGCYKQTINERQHRRCITSHGHRERQRRAAAFPLQWCPANPSAIRFFASKCNNACLKQLRLFTVGALCFWHVKFYHIWQHSIFCICFIMQKKEGNPSEELSLSRSDVIRRKPKRSESEKILISTVKRRMLQEKLLFSTLEKFISERVLSVFSHEFTSSLSLPQQPASQPSPTATRKKAENFEMNNKHFQTHNARHRLKPFLAC